MSNLAAYCPPINSGAPPPSTAKRPPPTSSFNANNYPDNDNPPSSNNDDDQEEEGEQQTELKRRCIDYHTPAVLDLTSRLYRKSNRRSHALPGGAGLAYPYLQCHTNYVSLWFAMFVCILDWMSSNLNYYVNKYHLCWYNLIVSSTIKQICNISQYMLISSKILHTPTLSNIN